MRRAQRISYGGGRAATALRLCSSNGKPPPASVVEGSHRSVFDLNAIKEVVGCFSHIKCVSAAEVLKKKDDLGTTTTTSKTNDKPPQPPVAEATVPEMIRLKPSSDPTQPPTVYFVPPTPSQTPSELPPWVFEVHRSSLPELLYKITSPTCDYVATRIALLKAGFKRIPMVKGAGAALSQVGGEAGGSSGVQCDGASYTTPPANVVWGKSISLNSGTPSPAVVDPLATDSPIAAVMASASEMTVPFQRFNHFPKGHLNLGCKEGLARNLVTWGAKLKRRVTEQQSLATTDAGGRSVDWDVDAYYPKTYFYPSGEALLKEAMLTAPNKKFIWKPSRGSCGRGILLCPGGSERHFNETKKQIERYKERANEIMDGAKVSAADEAITGLLPTPTAPVSTSLTPGAAARGITLANPKMFERYVVQEYLENPLLIEGRKFDLRLYVLATRYHPFTVAYRHEIGFARFAASKYRNDTPDVDSDGNSSSSSSSADSLSKYAYLTNFSIGRKLFAAKGNPVGGAACSPDGVLEVTSPEDEARRIDAIKDAAEKAGELKWTLNYLNHVLTTRPDVVGVRPGRKVDIDSMWKDVDTVICSTLEAVRANIGTQFDPSRRRPSAQSTDTPAKKEGVSSASIHDQPHFSDSYFELYGFDIMFDDLCKPWLIEVNTLPSLESSSLKDYYVKGTVVSDLLNTAQISPFVRTSAEKESISVSSSNSLDGSAASVSSSLKSPSISNHTGMNHCHSVEDRRVAIERRNNISKKGGEDETVTVGPLTVPMSLRNRLRDEARDSRGFKRITPAPEVAF